MRDLPGGSKRRPILVFHIAVRCNMADTKTSAVQRRPTLPHFIRDHQVRDPGRYKTSLFSARLIKKRDPLKKRSRSSLKAHHALAQSCVTTGFKAKFSIKTLLADRGAQIRAQIGALFLERIDMLYDLLH